MLRNCLTRNLLNLATVVALATTVAAQSQVPVYKAVTPQFAGTYNMTTGQLEGQGTTGGGPIYNNNTLANYFSVPGRDEEWIDEGQFCGQNEIQIDGFDFTYCSTEADPAQNSGVITFAFYDEYTICTGPANGGNFADGGYACAYDIVGLPLGDPNGVIQCWVVTLDLSNGFECPNTIAGKGGLSADEANDKLFGWGIIPRNNNTGPWLAKGGKGADNSFVWFDSLGTPRGCYWFGGTPFASFAIGITGCDDGSQYCYVGTGPAASLAWDVSLAPGVLTVDNQSGTDAWLLASSGAADIIVASCNVLINPSTILPTTAVPAVAGLNNYSVPSGITAYLQLMTTANGAPPSASNLPNGCSTGCRVLTQ